MSNFDTPAVHVELATLDERPRGQEMRRRYCVGDVVVGVKTFGVGRAVVGDG